MMLGYGDLHGQHLAVFLVGADRLLSPPDQTIDSQQAKVSLRQNPPPPSHETAVTFRLS